MKAEYFNIMVIQLEAALERAEKDKNNKTKVILTKYQIDDLLVIWKNYSVKHFGISDVRLPFPSIIKESDESGGENNGE